MNNLVTFNFKDNQVRTEVKDGEPWFCLTDCRAALSIKGSLKVGTLSEKGAEKISILTKGGVQELTFINEPNLYRLIFRSNKPQAQAFADWVYSEVLPSIRKTGGYGTPAIDMKAIGGMIKKCCAVAVREEIAKLLKGSGEKTEGWEVSDSDILLYLHRWHLTRNKEDTLKFRQLYGQYEEVSAENSRLKEKTKQIKALANSVKL